VQSVAKKTPQALAYHPWPSPSSNNRLTITAGIPNNKVKKSSVQTVISSGLNIVFKQEMRFFLNYFFTSLNIHPFLISI